MSIADDEIEALRARVEREPDDTFHRCNLACSLAAGGSIEEALLQLAAAFGTASTPITVGCVAAAVRDVADWISRPWSLPLGTAVELDAIA